MKRKIRKVAVLGAGVMGSGIAAHLANADIPTCLLDIVPKELSEEDVKKGLTKESPAFRNKFALMGIENALKARPAAFYVPEDARLITPGNFDDHMHWLQEADWIIEVVMENLEIKKGLFKKVEEVRKPGAIVSTNTLGISIDAMSEELSEEFREHFLGTHFFNPPRYMRLIELIEGKSTKKEILSFMTDFCEWRLGKGVVFAKDTPNFIANRIGAYGIITVMRTMVEDGYTVEEVDAITGPAMGRPKSATFRTADLVGLDVFAHVAKNVYDNIEDENEKKEFVVPELITKMVEMGLLGEKVKQGFYKKVKTEEGSEIYSLDYNTMDYIPCRKVDFPSLKDIKRMEGLAKKLKTLVYCEDRAGQFAWKVMKDVLLYSARRIPEIADDILKIDKAMKWGFNWELGPFATWDAIGVKESVERMEKEGEEIPENVKQMLLSGKERFYEKKDGKSCYFDFKKSDYEEIEEKSQIIILPSLKEREKLIKSNSEASLIDLGDGVACLEFHSPINSIGAELTDMMSYSVGEVEENFEGLLIGNHGRNFCVGANLMLLLMGAQSQQWEQIRFMVQQLQGALMRLK